MCKLHNHSVNSLLLHENVLFSGGDRRVVASDYINQCQLCVITRTAGDIPSLTQLQNELFYGESNGAIRTCNITHDPTQMIPGKAFWEHSRSVTKIMWAHPSNGLGERQNMAVHVCVMYTCSEDRTVRVWSTTSYECIKIVDTRS